MHIILRKPCCCSLPQCQYYHWNNTKTNDEAKSEALTGYLSCPNMHNISKIHEICRLHALIHRLTSLFSSLCNIASLAGNQTSICRDLACTDKTCVCSLSWQLPKGYDDGAEWNQRIMTVFIWERKKNMAPPPLTELSQILANIQYIHIYCMHACTSGYEIDHIFFQILKILRSN